MDGNIYARARKELRASLDRHDALRALEEELEKLGSIEQVTQEALRRQEQVKAELATFEGEAQAQREKAQADLRERLGKLEEASGALAQVRREAEEAVNRVQAQVAAQRSEGEAEKRRLIAQGETDAESIVKAASRKKAEIDKEVDEAEERRVAVNGDIAAAEQRLAAVIAEIDRLKQRFAS